MTTAVCSLLLALATLPGVAPPYEGRLVTGTSAGSDTRVLGHVSCDLDGDGHDELVTGVRTGIILTAWDGVESRVIDQINLPHRFVDDGGAVRLGPAFDADGDGRCEILATAATADGWEQRLWLLDLETQIPRYDAALPAGPDLREDGRWDGWYRVLELDAAADPPLVVLVRHVEYDRVTRAVVACDARTGEVLWREPTAGNVDCAVSVDLDGDGRREIAVTAGSADNLLPGEEVRGRRDDESWVMVLDREGRRLWERRVGPAFDNPVLSACDLDGDGAVELVVASQCFSQGFANELRVLAGRTGAVLATTGLGPACRGMWALPSVDNEPASVVCVLADGRLVRFAFAGGDLQLTREVDFGSPLGIVMGADVLPSPGPEFLVGTADLHTRLLAADLDLLANLPAWETSGRSPSTWDVGGGSILIYPNATGRGMLLVRTPLLRRYAGVAGAGGVVAGLGLAFGALIRQRRRLRRLRRTSRRDLLRVFLTSRHGTVGPVAALERTLWALENADSGRSEPPAAQWGRCRREAVPELEALLEKAEQVRVDPPLSGIVRRELHKLVGLLGGLAALPADDRQRDGVIVAARTSLSLVADGMKSLGATLAASCLLDPLPVVREVLARHTARHPGVVFALRTDAAAPPGPCHVDAADLEFAVDNLLDNAARHLADTARPTVTLDARRDGDRVFLEVTDNGPGVPETDRERIFAEGVSTRPGGGLGLWHSREALRYYGGDITVAEAPGGGARFTLRLRAAAG